MFLNQMQLIGVRKGIKINLYLACIFYIYSLLIKYDNTV